MKWTCPKCRHTGIRLAKRSGFCIKCASPHTNKRWTCNNCHLIVDNRCRICKRCANCGHGAHECGRCQEGAFDITKCICKGRPAVRHDLATDKPSRTNPSPRQAGIELELGQWCGIENWTGVPFRRKGDSSVSPSGAEMVLEPAGGARLEKTLLKLHNAVQRYRCTVNTSCGTHVHVNAKDLNIYDIRKIVIAWAAIERPVYRYLLDPSRSHSTYCRPWYSRQTALRCIDTLAQPTDRRTTKERILDFCYSDGGPPSFGDDKEKKRYYRDLRRQGRDHYGGGRYRSLNVHAYFYLYTLEFRCKEGMVNNELKIWPIFCTNFVDIACSLTEAELQELHSLRGKSSALRKITARMPRWLSAWTERRLAGHRPPALSASYDDDEELFDEDEAEDEDY